MYPRTNIKISDNTINKFSRFGDKILLNPFENLLCIDVIFIDFILFIIVSRDNFLFNNNYIIF